MRKVNTEELYEQLMGKIDTSNLKEVEKVGRYCDLVEIAQQCRAKVKEEGPSIVIENGSQRFVKSHPSMNDITKINAQIIALEKTFIFKLKDEMEPAPTTSSTQIVEGKDERGGLI